MTTQNTLAIPDLALVVIMSTDDGDAERLIATLDGFTPIRGQNLAYDEMKAEVFAALENGRSAAFYHPDPSKQLRRSLCKWARTAGAARIGIQIGNSRAVPAPEENFNSRHLIEAADIPALEIHRTRMPVDLRHVGGAFDIIGDVHGCLDELTDLLLDLGYASRSDNAVIRFHPHPDGRQLCFLGDLTDRGPKSADVLQLVHRLSLEIGALTVLGNHDEKLKRWLLGRKINPAAGLQMTIQQIEDAEFSEDYRSILADWLGDLPTHYVLDDGWLILAHAGLAERFHGKESAEAEAFALYGERSGEIDTDGFPLTRDWAADYAGSAKVVHGHVVTDAPREKNNVISIDTGCVFGGALTAYRYPEGEYVAVPARRTYFQYKKRTPARTKAT